MDTPNHGDDTMEYIKIQPRQHELLKTFCRLTGRSQEEVLDEILLDWASNVAKAQMKAQLKAANGAPDFLGSSVASGKPGATKIIVMPHRPQF
jgi:hypothetical protein